MKKQIRGRVLPFPAPGSKIVPCPEATGEVYVHIPAGHSMWSANPEISIIKGATVICRRYRGRPVSGKATYVVQVYDRLTIKKLRPNPDGTITLLGNNPAYIPETFRTHQIKIVAVVIGVWRECPDWRSA